MIVLLHYVISLASLGGQIMCILRKSVSLYILTAFFALSFGQTLSPKRLACEIVENDSSALTQLAAGECRCTSNSSPDLMPYCIYQVKPDGAGADELIRISRAQIKPSMTDPDRILPQPGLGGSTITWWFNNASSNQQLGQLLIDRDKRHKIMVNDIVTITTTIYSFKKDFNRTLGLNVAINYGNQPPATLSNKFGANLAQGLFHSAATLGNPLASMIQLGIDASRENKVVEIVDEYTTKCEVGIYCDLKSMSGNYFTGNNYSSSIIRNDVGFRIQTRPYLDIQDNNLVTLGSLYLTYSKKTEDPNTPVKEYVFYAGRDLDIKTDGIQILGSEVLNLSTSDKELLSSAKGKGYEQFLIMLKVQVQRGDEALNADTAPNPFLAQKSFSEYSEEEIALLKKSNPSLEDIFKSIEWTCYPNYLEPMSKQSICGFHFTKMNTKYLQHKLNIEFIGTKNLPMSPMATQCNTLGCLYNLKGNYIIPITDSGNHSLKVRIELDNGSPVAKQLRSSEPVKGIEFPLDFDPSLPIGNISNPISFNANLIKILNK